MKTLSRYLIVGILLVLAFPTYIGMAESDLGTPSVAWHEALTWLKGNTPQDSVILAWWEYGYWIEYLGDRTAFLTPSQNVPDSRLIAQYFMSYDDSVSLPEGIGYMIVDEFSVNNYKNSMALWAGLDYRMVNYDKTLIHRLWNDGYVKGHELVYNGEEIKIFEVIR